MGDLLLPIELVVAAVILILILAGAVFARRRTIARGEPLIICGLRERGSRRWRIGLARYGDDTLAWFTLAGPSFRPSRRWLRRRLELGAPQVPEPDPRLAVMPDAVVVSAECAGQHFELALGGGAHTALVSWLEACPPGYNLYVA